MINPHDDPEFDPEFDTQTDVRPVDAEQTGLASEEVDDPGTNLLEQKPAPIADILPADGEA